MADAKSSHGATLVVEPARIGAKFGNRPVPVDQKISKAIVDVASMQDLAIVAERFDGMILAELRNGVHNFTVGGEAVTYRYRSRRVDEAKLPVGSVEDSPAPPASASGPSLVRTGQVPAKPTHVPSIEELEQYRLLFAELD